jgi:hypothetical protein
MNRPLHIVGLLLLAVGCNGCATNSLLHAVGQREEMPANITQAWSQKDTLVIDYVACITDGDGNHLQGTKPIDRQAIFDLSKRVAKNQYNVGQILTNVPRIACSSISWTAVPRITGGMTASALLTTNAIAIEGSQAGVFRLYCRSNIETNDPQAIYCRLETRKWTLWWRRPAQIVGFPFACVIDAVALPFNAAIWGLFLIHENDRSTEVKDHTTKTK